MLSKYTRADGKGIHWKYFNICTHLMEGLNFCPEVFQHRGVGEDMLL
jgi:hypothetical protein